MSETTTEETTTTTTTEESPPDNQDTTVVVVNTPPSTDSPVEPLLELTEKVTRMEGEIAELRMRPSGMTYDETVNLVEERMTSHQDTTTTEEESSENDAPPPKKNRTGLAGFLLGPRSR